MFLPLGNEKIFIHSKLVNSPFKSTYYRKVLAIRAIYEYLFPSSSSQLSPKKISDNKPNAMNNVNSAGNIMHQGNNNTNKYNAQQQKQADQQQLQAKKRSQQQEQK